MIRTRLTDYLDSQTTIEPTENFHKLQSKYALFLSRSLSLSLSHSHTHAHTTEHLRTQRPKNANAYPQPPTQRQNTPPATANKRVCPSVIRGGLPHTSVDGNDARNRRPTATQNWLRQCGGSVVCMCASVCIVCVYRI